jgi:tryptophanyl-tRNA synthetase
MTQFKDKSAMQEFVSAGLFMYPVLQAADILLYRASGVPVGEDQVQHLELSRRIARRFNGRYGDVFPEPEPIVGRGARIMSLADPGIKMSKSAGEQHYVGVMEAEDVVRGKVRTAVTDMGLTPGSEMSEGVRTLFEILDLAAEETGQSEEARGLREEYEAGTLMYSRLKEAVSDALITVLEPIRRRRAELEEAGVVEDVLQAGAAKARKIARETLDEARAKVGLG